MYVEMILLLSFPPEERHCASSTPIGNLQHRSTRILPSAVPHSHSLVAVRNTLLSIGIRALPALPAVGYCGQCCIRPCVL